MLKKTIHCSQAAHLSTINHQLIVEIKDEERTKRSIHIEDIGVLILEHPQITFTMNLLSQLLENKVAVISCDQKYMPNGMFLPLESNSVQTERMRIQLQASVPLKKQLWQQTIVSKIDNQARLLAKIGFPSARLEKLKSDVLSGDTSNCEGQAAAHYWDIIYGNDFVRSRDLQTPNAQLNYGYAILRSVVARALVSSGLFPSFGIFHKNKYNAFCLADDIMEPYRPYVDWMVLNLIDINECEEGLNRQQKIELLKLPQIDVLINNVKRPLFHAVSITTASLFKCYAGEQRKISYPSFE